MQSLVAGMVLTWAGIAGALAAETSSIDALGWLKKIASASRQTSYAGTFVYHQGSQVGTLRITHQVDAAGEHEKLETLDGPSREIVRDNDRVTCYLADSKTVLVEKRSAPRFPAALPLGPLSGITDNYNVRKGEHDRVAGMDCQVIVLEPKDNLRYGRRFCAEMATGLPLRARTVNERNEVVELLAFTQIRIGDAAVKEEGLKSQFADKSHDWRVDRSGLIDDSAQPDSGWELKGQIQGFRKLAEMRRSLPGGANQMSQIVYSDGLAAVSAFIEPLPKNPPALGAANHGAVNIFVRPQADSMVTVIGEAPARTVKQVAEMLAPKNK